MSELRLDLFVSRLIQSIKFLRCYVTEGGERGFSKVVTRRYMGGGSEILKKSVT